MMETATMNPALRFRPGDLVEFLLERSGEKLALIVKYDDNDVTDIPAVLLQFCHKQRSGLLHYYVEELISWETDDTIKVYRAGNRELVT